MPVPTTGIGFICNDHYPVIAAAPGAEVALSRTAHDIRQGLPNARAKVTDPPASSRLQPAQGPGQATHKLALRSVPDVDDEVRHLIEVAYQQSG